MFYKSLLFLFIILLISSASASCLTDIEKQEIEKLCNETEVSAPLIINIFERICQGDVVNKTLNEKLIEIDAILNQSSLIAVLEQVTLLYNQSLQFQQNNTALENKIYDRIDNITTMLENEINSNYQDFLNTSGDLLSSFKSLEDQVYETMTEKQTTTLTLNRIIGLIIGIAILILVVWYISTARKKQSKLDSQLKPIGYEGFENENTPYKATNRPTDKRIRRTKKGT